MLRKKNHVIRLRQGVRDAASELVSAGSRLGLAEERVDRAHTAHSQALDAYASALRAQVYSEQKKARL